MKKIICGENVAYKETNNADVLIKGKERYIINGFADKYFNKVDLFVFSKDCQNYAYTALNYKIFRGITSYIVSNKGIIFETKKYKFYSPLPLNFIKGKILFAVMEHKDKEEYLFFKDNDITIYSKLSVLIGSFLKKTNNKDIVLYVEEKNEPYLIINNYKISLKENNIFPAMPEGIYVSEDQESYMIFLLSFFNSDNIINKCIYNDKLIDFQNLPLKGNLTILEEITEFGRYSFGNEIKFKFSSKGDWLLKINDNVYLNGEKINKDFDSIEINDQ